MPRWVFVLVVLMGLLTAAFVITDTVLGLRPGVTERNVRRLKEGMTVSEVEAILGKSGVGPPLPSGTLHFLTYDYFWSGAEGTARVSFIWWADSPRKVVRSASFSPAPAKHPLAWLGW